ARRLGDRARRALHAPRRIAARPRRGGHAPPRPADPTEPWRRGGRGPSEGPISAGPIGTGFGGLGAPTTLTRRGVVRSSGGNVAGWLGDRPAPALTARGVDRSGGAARRDRDRRDRGRRAARPARRPSAASSRASGGRCRAASGPAGAAERRP